MSHHQTYSGNTSFVESTSAIDFGNRENCHRIIRIIPSDQKSLDEESKSINENQEEKNKTKMNNSINANSIQNEQIEIHSVLNPNHISLIMNEERKSEVNINEERKSEVNLVRNQNLINNNNQEEVKNPQHNIVLENEKKLFKIPPDFTQCEEHRVVLIQQTTYIIDIKKD